MSTKKIIIIALTVLTSLIVAFFVYNSNPTDQNRAVADNFIQALSRQDSTTSFELMSRTLQTEMGGFNSWDDRMRRVDYQAGSFELVETHRESENQVIFIYIYEEEDNRYRFTIYTGESTREGAEDEQPPIKIMDFATTQL